MMLVRMEKPVNVIIRWYGYYREGDHWEERLLRSKADENAMVSAFNLRQNSELIIYPVVEVTDDAFVMRDYAKCVTYYRIPDAPPWRGGATPGPPPEDAEIKTA